MVWHMGYSKIPVLDDGRWLCEIPTTDELAQLRADGARATEYADLAAKLDDDLMAATMELRWWRGEGPGDGLALFGLRGEWGENGCDEWYAKYDVAGGPSPWVLLCANGTKWIPTVYDDEGEELYRGEPMGLLAAMREAEREALARGWVP